MCSFFRLSFWREFRDTSNAKLFQKIFFRKMNVFCWPAFSNAHKNSVLCEPVVNLEGSPGTFLKQELWHRRTSFWLDERTYWVFFPFHDFLPNPISCVHLLEKVCLSLNRSSVWSEVLPTLPRFINIWSSSQVRLLQEGTKIVSTRIKISEEVTRWHSHVNLAIRNENKFLGTSAVQDGVSSAQVRCFTKSSWHFCVDWSETEWSLGLWFCLFLSAAVNLKNDIGKHASFISGTMSHVKDKRQREREIERERGLFTGAGHKNCQTHGSCNLSQMVTLASWAFDPPGGSLALENRDRSFATAWHTHCNVCYPLETAKSNLPFWHWFGFVLLILVLWVVSCIRCVCKEAL